ncbi:MAG: hypothetical protein AB8B85_00630 [Paracoccaceae bacterium]
MMPKAMKIGRLKLVEEDNRFFAIIERRWIGRSSSTREVEISADDFRKAAAEEMSLYEIEQTYIANTQMTLSVPALIGLILAISGGVALVLWLMLGQA